MPFTPTVEPDRYLPSPPPVLGNDRGYVERELRNLSVTIRQIQEAMKEMQEYLQTLP